MLQINSVNNGNCLELMSDINDKSIDMILCDLPYGVSACKWDSVIPFEQLWAHYERIIKDNGAIVLTASQPFTSALVMSNTKAYKHAWRWIKSRPSNPQLAKKAPLKYDEDVLCFSYGSIQYKPQGLKEIPEKDRKVHKPEKNSLGHCKRKPYIQTHTGYPDGTISVEQERGMHPTQKPVALFEYLIKTYTNEGELVLDNCAGSGTTAIACLRTNRNYILIEQETKYCDIANKRIAEFIL